MRVYGSDHSLTLSTLHDLGRWLGEAGDAKGAISAFEELLAAQEGMVGPDDPESLTTRHNLAHWRGVAGDARGAVAAFEALLADRERVFGSEYPRLNTRSALSFWRRVAVRSGRAEDE